VAFTGILVASFVGGPATIWAMIVIMTSLIIYLRWWLHGRLICLSDSDICIIGNNLDDPHVSPRTKGGDDDASINILLAGGPPTKFEDKENYWSAKNVNLGNLVEPQSSILNIHRKYVEDEDHARYMKALHSEFEGSGIRNTLRWAEAILVLLIAALIVPFPYNLILAFLAFVLSLFAGFDNFYQFAFNNPGNPLDVNPNLGTLGPDDIVFAKGNWVYDSLHGGWNEMHAIHACQIIGKMGKDADGNPAWPDHIEGPDGYVGSLGLDTPGKVKEAIGAWCGAAKEAEGAEDGGNRTDPA
jgi:hypothetical protein